MRDKLRENDGKKPDLNVPANSTPLNLCLISRRYQPQIGGAERVMANMAHALASEGHLVTVLSSQNDTEGVAATADISPANQAENPKLVRLPYSGRRVLGTLGYMSAMRRWLKRYRPDLIYVSMLKHDAYVAVKAGKSLGVPVVLRPEGAGETGDLAWQKRGRFGHWIGQTTRQADAYIALSPRIENELLEAGFDAQKIYPIANGVPVPKVEPTAARAGRLAVFVGRLAPEKGLDTLLNAWPEVVRSFPDARLKLVGTGPLEAELKRKVAELQIGPSVEFAGARNDVQAILGQASLFLLPSREEGLSMALLEAMAQALPVVVSDIPGNRILVTPDITGWVFPPNQAKMLAAKIKEAFGDEERTAAMAEVGRGLVQGRYSIEAVARQHLELFRRLIDESQRRGGMKP